MRSKSEAMVVVLAIAASFPQLAWAAPQLSKPDANGFVWATIGSPGNPDAPPVGGFWFPDPPRGSVDYEYRMSRTELTVEQWFEFVNAYSPFAALPNSATFTGSGIFPNYDGTYYIIGNPEVTKTLPAEINIRYAARYTNWLHNGKVNEQWAFESGVYDTSTFGQIQVNGLTVYTDDYRRSPDAKYWIPSLDEWVKAMYYDPNRYGEGEGGYWSFPHSSEELPVYGMPEDGGETNAGWVPGEAIWNLLPIGSYPDVQSPWGLLDGSGGLREYVFSTDDGILHGKGSEFSTTDMFHAEVEHYESLAYYGSFVTGRLGLRVASAVPVPGASGVSLAGIAGIILISRKRKR